MVVDDQPDTVELATAILEMNEFEVLAFTEPRKALDSLKSGSKPDLIILDVRMPDLSGPELCNEVRKDDKIKNQKIAFFTASSDADNNLLKETGALGFIFKPFDNDKLVEDVNHYLSL